MNIFAIPTKIYSRKSEGIDGDELRYMTKGRAKNNSGIRNTLNNKIRAML